LLRKLKPSTRAISSANEHLFFIGLSPAPMAGSSAALAGNWGIPDYITLSVKASALLLSAFPTS
jgi:hypothetical protein